MQCLGAMARRNVSTAEGRLGLNYCRSVPNTW
jgi:hypothetical protein